MSCPSAIAKLDPKEICVIFLLFKRCMRVGKDLSLLSPNPS